MLVKIQFRAGPRVRLGGNKNQQLALAFASLLKPAVFGAWCMVLWRIASDLKYAESFAIERGAFSHWQMWLAIALGLHASDIWLSRFGKRPKFAQTEPVLVEQETPRARAATSTQR